MAYRSLAEAKHLEDAANVYVYIPDDADGAELLRNAEDPFAGVPLLGATTTTATTHTTVTSAASDGGVLSSSPLLDTSVLGGGFVLQYVQQPEFGSDGRAAAAPPTVPPQLTSADSSGYGTFHATMNASPRPPAAHVDENAYTFMCSICMCEQEPQGGFTVSGCGHRFCKACVAGYTAYEVLRGHVQGLGCPTCRCPFQLYQLQQLLSADEFDKYTRFVKVQKNANYRACPSCNHLQLGNPKKPAMTCERPECQSQFCFAHSNAHPNQTCSQYVRATRSQQSQNEAYVRRHTVICPNKKCGIAIHKSGGCNHMHCSACHTSFCYLCRRIVGSGAFPTHFKWWNLAGCPGIQSLYFLPGNCPLLMYLWRLCALILLLIAIPLVAAAVGLFLAYLILWLVFAVTAGPFVLCYICSHPNRGFQYRTFKRVFWPIAACYPNYYIWFEP